MSSNNFFKDGPHNNHWVRHSVMKPVDAVAFQKRNSLREDRNDKSDNFEMEIHDEGALDKALEGTEKYPTKTRRKTY